ncbi:hypothetical protein GCM10009737_07010 [Nocardioides lentus]|uniref:Lipoprotein n=2 Tax=Nocardioides lentus TaxID=338077 RepID=A0ABN2P023_9ACTN
MFMDARLAAIALGVALLTACAPVGTGGAGESGSEPTSGSPAHAPSSIPSGATGGVTAYVGQSSTDAAMGRMQVYVENGTGAEIDPDAVRYLDPRLGGPRPGDRLRAIPAGSARGYLVALPQRPACGGGRDVSGRVVLDVDGTRTSVQVVDPTGVVRRHVALRCDAAATDRLATMRWLAPEVDGRGASATAFLVLALQPTGESGRLRVDRVNGTPVLAPVGSDVWRPAVEVAGTGAPRELRLPVRPRRCDPHAFQESGGATAMRMRLHVDGRPGEIVLRMDTSVAAAVIDHALDVCGLGGP